MSDFWWPKQIKPLTNKNYSTSRGNNVILSGVAGGVPRIGLDATLESPEFSLNFVLSDLQHQVCLNFYDAKINHGANSFKMNLDSGNGIEEHQCNIKPKTWKASRPSHGNWYLAFSVIAETTSTQLNDCTNVYDLYECYGDSICDVITGMDDLLERLPDA